ncbi:hypothetical protein QLX67_05755 [Balneolaceae bacterium ANBcel3]|nr:hypothetical protein [Balneolaceae bacterium ANBcel3]
MRLVRFLLFFLGAALLVIGPIFLLNKDSFIRVFQNREALLDGREWVAKTHSLGGLISFIGDHPEHGTIVSVSSDPAHTPIRFATQQAVPAGTLNRIVLLAGLTEQTLSGNLETSAPVSPEKITRWYLNGADENHLRRFNRWLNSIESDPTLRELMLYYIRTNDPAVHDYFFFVLGEDYLAGLVQRLDEEYGSIGQPVPLWGLRQILSQKAPGMTSESFPMDRDTVFKHALKHSQQHLKGDGDALSTGIEPVSFQEQRIMHALFPHIHPEHFAAVLLAIFSGDFMSPEISEKLKNVLLTDAEDRLLEPHIQQYAAHFDEGMGYLAGWTYARLADSGHHQVQVIVLYNLPPGLWFHMNSNFMIRDYHHRLFYDSSAIERSLQLKSEPMP